MRVATSMNLWLNHGMIFLLVNCLFWYCRLADAEYSEGGGHLFSYRYNQRKSSPKGQHDLQNCFLPSLKTFWGLGPVCVCVNWAWINCFILKQVYEFVQLSELYYAGSHGMDIMGPANSASVFKINGTLAKDKMVIFSFNLHNSRTLTSACWALKNFYILFFLFENKSFLI